MGASIASDVADDLASAALAMARRFAAGASMWCIAPEWPEHGRHVAVEFVHPVVIGKRALPAVHVDGADLIGAVRLLARPGDLLLAIGPANDDRLAAILQRSDAWGITSIWLAAGHRPPAPWAEHGVWLEVADAEMAARSGDLVLLYHLLWELTHVVFEHPGLLDEPSPGADDRCVTCADEGRLAEVVEVLDGEMADVLAAGGREAVNVSLVGPVVAGDLVLVHAGVAITMVAGAGR